MGKVDFRQLVFNVPGKRQFVGLSVLVVVRIGLLQHVERHVVDGIEPVMAVNLRIDMGGKQVEELALADGGVERHQVVVDTRRTMVVDTSLIPHYTRAHAHHIVLCRLAEGSIVAFLLKLLGFEEIAGVVLIGDGQGHDMQVDETVAYAPLPSHRHHFEDGGLGAVVGVLCTSFTLCYPQVLVFLANGKVHVVCQPSAGKEHLPWWQAALHDERLVHPHQVAHPRQREQVVADGNLTGGVEPCIYEQLVEQSRVEHDIAVVAHESVAASVVDGVAVDVTAFRGLVEQVDKETIAEGFLEFEAALALSHLRSHGLQGHIGIEVCKHRLELFVGQQSFECFGQFLGLVGPYAVVFTGYFHGGVYIKVF